jgi:glyceraldehyde-3-phosphate dehydrogenase (NADP+)
VTHTTLQEPGLTAGRLPSGESTVVVNPYSGTPIGEVRQASEDDTAHVLDAAVAGSLAMRKLAGHQRSDLLDRGAALCDENIESMAQLIVEEQGKTVTEARGEAGRLGSLLRYCAGEARRIGGEVLPIDGTPGGEGRLGFTMRQPAGVVVAISPFNYPMLLVAHKVGPALAAGNAVIVKPSSYTPMSALRFLGLIAEAGFPEGAVQCVIGAGSTVGTQLCRDTRVRVVSFTGSVTTGNQISSVSGVKRLLMELGANCPIVVLPDADLGPAAAISAKAGTVNAGQVCISAQRVLVDRRVEVEFADLLVAEFEKITAGDPTDDRVSMGPMISAAEAERVRAVIGRATDAGAELLSGGGVSGALHEPTIVGNVPIDSELFVEELFGPAVAMVAVDGVDEAIGLCNQTSYGLGAGVFTRDVNSAMRFAREVDAGNIHINWSPLWRMDPMPYGGLKGSGIGKEGPRYAIEEMTEAKTVIIHPG